MQVSPVSLAFEGNKKPQKQVVITPEQFAEFDDRQLALLSNAIASDKVNDKKHQKINRAMFYNLPLAAGIAGVASATGASRISKLGMFGSSFAGMAVGLMAANGIFAGMRKLQNSSEKVREFNKKYPLTSTIGTLGAAFAALFYGGKGLGKLAQKVMPKVYESGVYKKLAPKAVQFTEKLATKLNGSVVLNKLSKLVAKVPSPIKAFTKTLAKNAPWVLIAAQLGHAMNHKATRASVAMETFAELKGAQAEVRQNIVDSEYADELANLGV